MMNDEQPQHPVTNPAYTPNPHPKPLPPRTRGRVFDVMRPGQAPASATSRPVVIGHKAGAQASQINVSGVGERSALLDPHRKVHIGVPSASQHHAPAMASKRPATTTVLKPEFPKPAPPKPAGPATETSAPALEAVPAHVDTPKITPQLEPEITMPGMIADKLAQAALEAEPAPPPPAPEHPVPPAHDPLQDEASPIAAPHLGHQPVVVSHHLHEPGSVWRVAGLVLLIVLLLAIVLDILMDTGILRSGGVPHTGFFGG